MTREQIIEVFQANLKRIDSTAQFSTRYVEGVLDLVWQNFIYDMVQQSGGDPMFYTKQYTPVPVSVDGNGWYYSDLPAPIIHLPRVSSGIVRISQVSGRDMDFAPISERDFTLMRSQDVYDISDSIYFYVTKDSVFYGDNMTASIVSSGVTIDMIIPFRTYDFDEDLPIPAGKAQMFLGMAYEFLARTMPVDLINKNEERR